VITTKKHPCDHLRHRILLGEEKWGGQVVAAYTVVSRACGVKSATKSVKRLARGLGRFQKTLALSGPLVHQHFGTMFFHIEWQVACGYR